ncbi:MAG: MFS transporter [Novosphingobium sp.]
MAEETKGAAAAEWRAQWPLALAAMWGISLTTLHSGSTGVMMEPLEQEFGWSRADIYLGNSLVSYGPMLLGTLAGLAIDRFGPRRIALMATALLCSFYALLSQVQDSLWQWWAIWGLIGFAISAMPAVWLAAVTGRFDKSRGLAIAIALSGTGLANFLVPPITHYLVEQYGWRGGYVGIAAIWAAIVLPLALMFFRGANEAPGRKAADKTEGPLPGLTARQGFASPSFWKLFLAAFLSTAGGVAIIMNMVPVLVSTGLVKGTAAWIAGIAGLSTIVGRIFGGWLMDRMNAKWIAAVATIVAVTLPVALLFLPGVVPAAVFGVFVYGFAGGAKIGAVVYLASRHLGQRAFGTLYATINAFMALGVGTAPLIANMIYDATKSYTPVIWAGMPLMVVASVVYASLGKYPVFGKAAAPTGEGTAG